MGDYPQAARLCQDILRAAPRNLMALHLLGYVQSQTGNFAEAERLLADSRCAPGGSIPSCAKCGLPEVGFDTYKLSPDLFDVRMRLLHSVKESVLWLP
jgi:Tetratricopeptide repeat